MLSANINLRVDSREEIEYPRGVLEMISGGLSLYGHWKRTSVLSLRDFSPRSSMGFGNGAWTVKLALVFPVSAAMVCIDC